MRRVIIQHEGEFVEGEEMDWKVLREEWNEYECSDGTKLKKTIVQKIIRLDKRNADGEPIYQVRSSNVVTAHVQPHLMVEGR